MLANKLDREPTPTEIAACVDIRVPKGEDKIEQVELLLFLDQRVASLHELVPGQNKVTHMMLLEDTHADQHDSSEETQEIVEEALKVLSDRERKIICMRFGLNTIEEGKQLSYIGESFHLSRERIRQIEAIALKKLEQPLRKELQRA
jgi:RNA polymerase primary sigma factor